MKKKTTNTVVLQPRTILDIQSVSFSCTSLAAFALFVFMYAYFMRIRRIPQSNAKSQLAIVPVRD